MQHYPLKALRTFEAVARNGGFSRAAEELHITQSAVSHQISALEEWMGRQLFDRTGARPTLLPYAQTLATALNGAFSNIASACDQARVPLQRSSLTIAVIPSVATCWFIPRLSEFRAENPDVKLHVMYAIHGQTLNFADVDMAIIYARSEPDIDGMDATKLLSGASAPVCSRAHVEASGPFETSDQIVAAGLLHDTDKTGWAQWLSATAEAETDPPDGPVFEDFNLLRAAALAGQGTALCPLSIIADDLRDGWLVRLSQQTIFDDSGYYLITPQEKRRTAPATPDFGQWLLQQAGVST